MGVVHQWGWCISGGGASVGVAYPWGVDFGPYLVDGQQVGVASMVGGGV